MPKTQFESRARDAVAYTRNTLAIGPDNITYDPGASLCVKAMRMDHPETMSWDLTDISWMADDAKKMRCGNCQEHAAVAFMYLYEDASARPLELLVEMRDGDAAHMFVIVGGQAGDSTSGIVVDAWHPALDMQVRPASELHGTFDIYFRAE